MRRAEARKVTTALAQTAAPSLAERVAELDERAGQIEARLVELQRSLAGMAAEVDPNGNSLLYGSTAPRRPS